MPTINWQPDSIRRGDAFVRVERGSFQVPAVRARPNAGQLTLHLVRFRSTSAQPGTPIVYLAGGPGDSGVQELQQAPQSWLDPLRRLGDVIGLDQRGTGASEPRDLRCEAGQELPLDRPGDPDLYVRVFRQRVQRCARRISARAVALSSLTTAENADDLETLRRALGARQIRLFGGSYGSHLALAAVRRHPRLVERMVLASIEGPDHTLKLPSQIDAGLIAFGTLLRTDTFYARQLPDLTGVVRKLIDQLRREPVRVSVAGRTVVLGDWDLRKRVADAVGRGQAMRQLPAALLAMSRGNFTDLGRWALNYRRETGMGMMGVVMDCASFASAERLARIRNEAASALVGGLIDFPFPEICQDASMPRLPDTFRTPIHADVPTLFLAGSLDARTPEANAREIAATMRNARVLVIDNGPHGIPVQPELQSVVHSFFRGEVVRVIRLELPWPPFVR
jgi:pimeloyl-ACP methyl ester carboxylesterase